jgi:hypothetical protein
LRLSAALTARNATAPLHGATTQELQHLTDADINHQHHHIRLGRRPQPTPLDPWTWTALQHCLDHRNALGNNNSHVLVTMQTKATRAPASDGYVKNGAPPRFRTPDLIRSDPEWRGLNARTAQKLHTRI